ncbi:MAG: trypsin-like peptidase domain-containing protein [Saccharofermentans sp.]|nr:trypsin-like peptidase domain-containing protein [Saccharofermentans sp.]
MKQHHHVFSSKLIAVALLLCLIGGVMAAGGNQAAMAETATLTAADIYEQNVNATVGITISAQTQASRYGSGYTYQASGSGFIISEDGYILTNYHVIEGYETVTVATYDDKTYDAKVIGYDETNDIAVIKVEAEGLSTVTLGNSDELRVGEDVLAIGNPLGELTFSLTRGIVSALSRNVRVESGNTMHLIQTDCAINSGNSGGALFNSYGEVIGITNAKYSGDSSSASVDNIGFAIPINSVRDIITSIIDKGYIEKPYIGVTVYDLDPRRSPVQGAAVYTVEQDSPADKAGLRKDDVITQVNGKDISGQQELRAALAKCKVGDEVELTVYRDGEELKLKVTLASYKKSALKDTRDT